MVWIVSPMAFITEWTHNWQTLVKILHVCISLSARSPSLLRRVARFLTWCCLYYFLPGFPNRVNKSLMVTLLLTPRPEWSDTKRAEGPSCVGAFVQTESNLSRGSFLKSWNRKLGLCSASKANGYCCTPEHKTHRSFLVDWIIYLFIYLK